MKLKMGKIIVAVILVFTMLSSLALAAFAAQTGENRPLPAAGKKRRLPGRRCRGGVARDPGRCGGAEF